MKKIVGLVIVGCLLMFVLSTVAVTANSSDSEFIHRGNETKTIILTNVSNSFPMFSDAEYVNFTIEDNTINLTLDLNASFDGVCNLSNLTGTDISADGSFAELNYTLISYHRVEYDQKWKSAPYFNDTENRLYLLAGSGLITRLNIELKENATDKTIPKVVGVGDLVGHFHIKTFAQGKNSTYNDLTSNITGLLGHADLYVQYAPDATYENVTFIPTFSQCEKLRLSANIFGSSIEYVADVRGGHANGVDYLEFNDIPLDSVTINETFDVEYHPINISGEVFNETWSVKPEQYKDTLVILRGTGNITRLDFTFDDRNTTHPEISSYGYLSGDYNVTENILPHYMNVIVEGTNVSAMDESGQGGFGITFA